MTGRWRKRARSIAAMRRVDSRLRLGRGRAGPGQRPSETSVSTLTSQAISGVCGR